MHCAADGGIFYHKGKNQILSRTPENPIQRAENVFYIQSVNIVVPYGSFEV